ncbi:MAG: tRNA (guanosine(37)-N1)-methyltransferase TrmD [Deltaproteobacteria bacterium]|nr:tRNA (guanosine(37)-N1)-methyltransferase TrmD [Deltaproteobacteria bacterium]
MRFDILTLFPEFFFSPLRQSIISRAILKGIIEVRTYNIRYYTIDKHRTTDDAPYGGGAGMVMKVEPVVKAIEAIKGQDSQSIVVLTTPQGVPFNQSLAKRLSVRERLVIVCGRYEGIDERIRDFVDMEVSVGDYVLTGGEVAALVIIDAVGRLVEGVIDKASREADSFSEDLLEYPHYTRPESFRDIRVPEVLLSGNHGEIAKWRRQESLRRTAERRADLIKKAGLTEDDIEYLSTLHQKKGER